MNDSVLIALIGIGGAVVGAVASMATQWMRHRLETRAELNRDQPRRDLLTTLLNDPKWNWRNLSTLQHVIGSDEETTKRLLLELGARASEDGKPIWGLVSRNPLPAERQ